MRNRNGWPTGDRPSRYARTQSQRPKLLVCGNRRWRKHSPRPLVYRIWRDERPFLGAMSMGAGLGTPSCFLWGPVEPARFACTDSAWASEWISDALSARLTQPWHTSVEIGEMPRFPCFRTPARENRRSFDPLHPTRCLMPRQLVCPHGHRWELDIAAKADGSHTSTVCPICSARPVAPNPRTEAFVPEHPRRLARIAHRLSKERASRSI